jgi:hypothetical protein
VKTSGSAASHNHCNTVRYIVPVSLSVHAILKRELLIEHQLIFQKYLYR